LKRLQRKDENLEMNLKKGQKFNLEERLLDEKEDEKEKTERIKTKKTIRIFWLF